MSKTLVALFICAFVVCSFAQEVLPGATLLNVGMDFRQGGLVPAEERAKSQIFEYNYDGHKTFSPAGRPDLKFKYSKDLTLTPTGGTVEQTSSEIMKSYSQTVKVDIKGFNFGVSIDTGAFGVGASYGREYGKIQERIKQEFKSISRGLYRSSVYKLIGRPHFLRKYHDDFEYTLDYIPSNPRTAEDYERYETCLDYFGGFFQIDSIFGGQVKSFNFMNTKLMSSRDEKWVREQISLSFRYKFFEVAGGGFRNRSEIKVDDFFTQNMKGDLAYHGGFRNLQNDKEVTKKWKHSIDDQSGLLDTKMRPVAQLVKNDAIKKANFDKIIQTYSLTGKVKSMTSELVNGKRKVPGYNVIGYGYDPVEMSIKQAVFEHDVNGFNKPTTYDKYAVPSSIKVIQTPKSTVEKVSVFTNKNDFIKAFVMKNVQKMSLGNAKRSRDVYEFLQHEAKGESKVEVEQQISNYDLKLNPSVYITNAEKYMNPALKKLIENKQYKRIIEEFGTDFTVAAKIGGYFRTDAYFKNELLKSQNTIKSEAKSLFESYSKVNGFQLFDAAYFTESSVTISGGRYRPRFPLDKKQAPIEQFSKSVKEDPEAFGFEILPISVLIKNPVEANAFNKAVEEYRQQISETDPLDENKIFTRDEIAEHKKF
eukprot:gene107-4356_t